MAESKMKEVAKLLGVEWGVPFKVKYGDGRYSEYNPYVFKDNALRNKNDTVVGGVLIRLLKGEYEIEQPILDEVEKRYLEGVFRPFKDRVERLKKESNISVINGKYECISYKYKLLDGYESACSTFPYFHKGTMYKGMELNKEYTLEELWLFQN